MELFINLVQIAFIAGHLINDYESSKVGVDKERLVSLTKWKVRFVSGIIVLEILLDIINGIISFVIFAWVVILILDIVQLVNLLRR